MAAIRSFDNNNNKVLPIVLSLSSIGPEEEEVPMPSYHHSPPPGEGCSPYYYPRRTSSSSIVRTSAPLSCWHCAPHSSLDASEQEAQQEYEHEHDDDNDDDTEEGNGVLMNRYHQQHHHYQRDHPVVPAPPSSRPSPRFQSFMDGIMAPFMNCVQPPLATCGGGMSDGSRSNHSSRSLHSWQRPPQAPPSRGVLSMAVTAAATATRNPSPTTTRGRVDAGGDATSSSSLAAACAPWSSGGTHPASSSASPYARKVGSVINSQIAHPTDADILCGRGGSSVKHPGNQNFRALVAANKVQYGCLPTKKQKMLVARQIVSMVHASGGRFLARDSDSGLWFDIGLSRSLEKTSQALREKTAGSEKGDSHAAAASPHHDDDDDDDDDNDNDDETELNAGATTPASPSEDNTKKLSSSSHRTNGKGPVRAPPIVIPDCLRGIFPPPPGQQPSPPPVSRSLSNGSTPIQRDTPKRPPPSSPQQPTSSPPHSNPYEWQYHHHHHPLPPPPPQPPVSSYPPIPHSYPLHRTSSSNRSNGGVYYSSDYPPPPQPPQPPVAASFRQSGKSTRCGILHRLSHNYYSPGYPSPPSTPPVQHHNPKPHPHCYPPPPPPSQYYPAPPPPPPQHYPYPPSPHPPRAPYPFTPTRSNGSSSVATPHLIAATHSFSSEKTPQTRGSQSVASVSDYSVGNHGLVVDRETTTTTTSLSDGPHRLFYREASMNGKKSTSNHRPAASPERQPDWKRQRVISKESSSDASPTLNATPVPPRPRRATSSSSLSLTRVMESHLSLHDPGAPCPQDEEGAEVVYMEARHEDGKEEKEADDRIIVEPLTSFSSMPVPSSSRLRSPSSVFQTRHALRHERHPTCRTRLATTTTTHDLAPPTPPASDVVRSSGGGDSNDCRRLDGLAALSTAAFLRLDETT